MDILDTTITYNIFCSHGIRHYFNDVVGIYLFVRAPNVLCYQMCKNTLCSTLARGLPLSSRVLLLPAEMLLFSLGSTSTLLICTESLVVLVIGSTSGILQCHWCIQSCLQCKGRRLEYPPPVVNPAHSAQIQINHILRPKMHKNLLKFALTQQCSWW